MSLALMCDTCGKTAPTVTLPDDWYALAHGGEHWHFHDEACLAIWRLTTLSLMPVQQPQDKPDCKARRFLLIDESANIVEGVKWGNGFVVLDHEQLVGANRYLFKNWEELKECNPGSGVQWIDQEVAE